MGADWLLAIVSAFLLVLKGFFGMDKPQETTVEHPIPDLEITDGKTDLERLSDLGL